MAKRENKINGNFYYKPERNDAMLSFLLANLALLFRSFSNHKRTRRRGELWSMVSRVHCYCFLLLHDQQEKLAFHCERENWVFFGHWKISKTWLFLKLSICLLPISNAKKGSNRNSNGERERELLLGAKRREVHFVIVV